jgi:hypothetical protein
MNEIRQSLGEIPIVEDELRKAAGEEEVKLTVYYQFRETSVPAFLRTNKFQF